VNDYLSSTIHREALLGPQSPMMPITPFGGSGITPTASTGGMFGSFGQAFSSASPSISSPNASYPFPTTSASSNNASQMQSNAPLSPQTPTAATPQTLSHEERSLIPPFYIIEPITPPHAAADSDTYISDALIDLYNKVLTFISKELGYILEITERRPAQGIRSTMAITGDGQSQMASSGFLDKEVGDRTIPGSPSTREKTLYAGSGVANKAGYEMLSNVVWSEIVKRLMNECGHLIFAAGRPDTFHRVSYTKCLPQYMLHY
jgi:hypothetical protein